MPSMDSSSSSCRWEYDVFLSFRGEDTRGTFTAHLCDALWRRGINTFIDDPKLRKGQVISPALLTAIENSMFCIIVLSTNYASSSWCLEELVKILESKTRTKERVLPIFYNVDPSEVRKQKGEFGKSFERLVENLTDPETQNRVQTWREALQQVANISGWDSRNRHEPLLIKEIITAVSNKLFSRYSSDEENLAGMDSRIEEVMSLLCVTSSDVVITGICGMGGIGKTTLANAVYSRICHQFESSAFLENVGKDFRKQGLISFKQKLLSLFVDDANLNIKGCTSIEGKLHRKKVLIVLDDVKDGALLAYLTANQDSFGPGSRIIVTTREKHLLTSYSVTYYEVDILDECEAFQVLEHYFSIHEIPNDDLRELSDRIICYAQGLPLALKILGPLLFGKNKTEWRSHLNKLERSPNQEINRILRISYDELDNTTKNIFLDIACFFKDEDKDHVMEILEACGFFPHCGIGTLLGKSLMTISDNLLKMHDLIQAMGMEVVRQNYPNEPGKWSRLWSHEDVSHVFEKKMATEEVEGIFFDSTNLREINFTSEAFARMNKLRLLRVHRSHISECSWNFTFPSRDLRYFYWHGYSLKSLPGDFDPKNLVELNMPYSQIDRLWKGKMALEKLKCLDLKHSKFLKNIPDLSQATNLERLVLEGCTSLCAVDPSLSNLKNLIFLCLRDCINLRYFSSSLELESLEILILSGCSKLSKFPEIKGHMKHLKELFLDGTAIEELPPPIDQCAPGLVTVDLSNCKKLKNLPNGICNLNLLEALLLSDCSKLEYLPPEFGKLKGLRKLHLDRTALRALPDSFADLRSSLQKLSFSGCKGSPTSASMLLPSKKSYSLDFLFTHLSPLHFLEDLNLSDCNIVDGMQLDSLCLLPSLRYLNLSRNNFVELPSSFTQLSRLRTLALQDCSRLQALPELPSSIIEIVAYNCESLEKIPNLSLKPGSTNCLKFEDYPSISRFIFQNVVDAARFQSRLHNTQDSSYLFGAIIPGSRIPEWFNHQSRSHEISISSSPNLYSRNFLGFAYCLAFNPRGVRGKFRVHVTISFDFYSLYRVPDKSPACLYLDVESLESDHIWQGFVLSPPRKKWQSIHISFTATAWKGEITIRQCGVRLMYIEDMIEYKSAHQPSSVLLQELDNLVTEEIGVKRTNGSSLELENHNDYWYIGDFQSEITINEGDPKGCESAHQHESSGNEGSKAQERKNRERKPHLWWDAAFAFGLILCVVAGSFWMRGRIGKRKYTQRKERVVGKKANRSGNFKNHSFHSKGGKAL